MAAETYQAVYLGDGNRVDYTPVAAKASGDVVVVNGVVGIATQDIAAGALGSLGINGVWRMVKITGVIAVGTVVYWDPTGSPLGGVAGSGCVTSTAGTNVFLGITVKAALDADQTVDVRIFGVPIRYQSVFARQIADPGNTVKAIPVTESGRVDLVSVGADETRTLAIPTFAGQQLLLTMKTDGGDIVITSPGATKWNAAANTTMTFGAVLDTVLLVGVYDGANLVWRIIANDGVALG